MKTDSIFEMRRQLGFRRVGDESGPLQARSGFRYKGPGEPGRRRQGAQATGHQLTHSSIVDNLLIILTVI
jgi:hypothetical protein